YFSFSDLFTDICLPLFVQLFLNTSVVAPPPPGCYTEKRKKLTISEVVCLIEILNGTHETVTYRSMSGVRAFVNRDAEDFPLHWHTALLVGTAFRVRDIYGEIICDGCHSHLAALNTLSSSMTVLLSLSSLISFTVVP